MSSGQDAIVAPSQLAHVIYYVSALAESRQYYCDVLGFRQVDHLGAGAVFLSLPHSRNYFDLGLIEVGKEAGVLTQQARSGVYHVGWAVASPEELWSIYQTLKASDLVIGASDHQTHLSLYSVDPDGNEVEILWQRHPSRWKR